MDPAAEAVAVAFGERVKQHRLLLPGRKGHPLSQEAFAQRVDLDRAYVSRIERGKANVTLYAVLRLAEALEVDPSVLVVGLKPQDSAEVDPVVRASRRRVRRFTEPQ